MLQLATLNGGEMYNITNLAIENASKYPLTMRQEANKAVIRAVSRVTYPLPHWNCQAFLPIRRHLFHEDLAEKLRELLMGDELRENRISTNPLLDLHSCSIAVLTGLYVRLCTKLCIRR